MPCSSPNDWVCDRTSDISGGSLQRLTCAKHACLMDRLRRAEKFDLCRHLQQLVGLGVDPPQGLQVIQVLVLRQRCGQIDGLVSAMLRHHHN